MSESALDKSLDDIIKEGGKGRVKREGRGRGRGRGRGGRSSGGRSRSRGGNSNGGGYGRQNRDRRNKNSRYRPYRHTGGTIEDIALGRPSNRVLKVSSNSEAKVVAGAIAQCVRIGGAPPAIMCTGAGATNQAVKAIAIARQYLTDGEEADPTDLIAQPTFDGKSSHLLLKLRRARPINMDKDFSGLTSTPSSDPYKVAGAIAGKVRDGERIGISAVGANAVFHAVEAVSISRRYLKEDRVDIKFTPSFTKVDHPKKGEVNGILFSILSWDMSKEWT